MAYLFHQQFIAKPAIVEQTNALARKKAKRFNFIVTMLISFINTLTLAWGIALEEIIRFLAGDVGNQPYMGFLFSLGFSIVISTTVSTIIQLLSILWMRLCKLYRNHSNSLTIESPYSTTQPQTTIDDWLDEVNFHIWSIIWHTTRGLGISLIIVSSSLIILR